MIEVQVDIDVDRPADEVFAYWSDWANNPQWQQGMERCTWTSEPPLRLGSTYDQEARFLGRPVLSSFEVVEFEPDRRVRVVSTGGTMPLDITREVTPRPDGGTTLHATIRGGPEGVLSAFDPLTRRMVARNVHKDYARLQALLDAGRQPDGRSEV